MNTKPSSSTSVPFESSSSVETIYAERTRNKLLAKQRHDNLGWEIAQYKASTAAALAAIEAEQAIADRQRAQQAQLARLQAEAEQRCRSAEATVQKLQERLSNMLTHDQQADEAAFRRHREIAAAAEHLVGLEMNIVKNREVLGVLNKTVQQKRTELSTLRALLARSTAKTTAVQLRFETLQAKRDEANQNVAERRRTVAANAAAIAEHTQRAAAVREKLSAQQQRHTNAAQALREHSEQHAERQRRIRQLTDREEQLQQEFEQLISEQMRNVLDNETALKQRRAQLEALGGEGAADAEPLTEAELDSVAMVCEYLQATKLSATKR